MFKTCLLLAVSILVLVPAQVQPQKSCRAVFSDMNKKQLGWINQCVKELGYKGSEKSKKSTCIMKCVMGNLRLLNEEGNIDDAQFNTFLTEQWPEHLRDRANRTFQPCKSIAAHVDQDEFCKGYDPLVKCLTRNFANLCRGT